MRLLKLIHKAAAKAGHRTTGANLCKGALIVICDAGLLQASSGAKLDVL